MRALNTNHRPAPSILNPTPTTPTHLAAEAKPSTGSAMLPAGSQFEVFTGKGAIQPGIGSDIPGSRLAASDIADFQAGLRTRLSVGNGTTTARYTRAKSKARQIPRSVDPGIMAQYNKLAPKQRLAYLDMLQKKRPSEYNRILEGVRAGTIKDQNVALPVSIKTLCDTQYARTRGEARDSIQYLKQLYNGGKVNFGPVSGLAHVIPDDPVRAQNHLPTHASVTLSPDLLSTPEGAAIVLGHEAMHAYRFYKGTNKFDLAEEVDGNMITGRLWQEIPKEYASDPKAQNAIRNLLEFSDAFDPKDPTNRTDMTAKVAANYAVSYVKEGQYDRASEILNELLASPDFDIRYDGSHEQITKMLQAAHVIFEKDPSFSKARGRAPSYKASNFAEMYRTIQKRYNTGQ